MQSVSQVSDTPITENGILRFLSNELSFECLNVKKKVCFVVKRRYSIVQIFLNHVTTTGQASGG